MSYNVDLAGKVIMITGAAGGIGAGTAKIFAQAGARLILTDVSDKVADLATELNAGNDIALPIVGDISDPEMVKNIVETGSDYFGQLDYAFNNAGISGTPSSMEDLDIDDWKRVVEINLSSVAYSMKYQSEVMKRLGGGVIINNSSVMGLGVYPEQSLAYPAAKHGVIGLTKQAAINHGKDGIRINAVCPGLIDTELVSDGKAGQADEWYLERIPLGRKGTPEDVGRIVLALCSDLGAYVTGVALPIDGGFLLF